MDDRRRLRRGIARLCAVSALGAAVAVASGFAAAAARVQAPEALPHLLLGAMIAIGGLLGFGVWAFFQLDARLIRPIAAIAHRLELGAAAEGPRSSVGPSPIRADLAAALADSADAALLALEAACRARDVAIEDATRKTSEQRRSLEAVVNALHEGVIVCGADGRILLCNRSATALLAGTEAVGLGRRLDRVLTPEPVQHATERLLRRRRAGEPDPTTTLVCGALASDRILQCHASLLPETSDTPQGYILSLRDMTGEIANHAERDRLLRTSLETTRRLASGLNASLEVLVTDAAMPEAARSRFERAAAEDAARLAEAVTDYARRAERVVAGHWPLADISSEDIAASAAARLAAESGLRLHGEGVPVWFRSDGASLVQLVCALAAAISSAAGTHALALGATAADAPEGHAYLDLCWRGERLAVARLEAVLERSASSMDGVTGREILERHGGEAWPDLAEDGRARLRVVLRQAREPDGTFHGARPEFYDFDIAATPEVMSDQRRLDRLACVVFDTETTGLNPSGGDRLVQIAGIRILNGRILRGETFESLVRPDRTIPFSATDVHGISDAMVAGAPGPSEVLVRFHAFAADAVLVAHNAAFDMAFLRRAEKAAGVTFDNPVLDTVLLSAFLEPDGTDYTLDALCARYGIGFAPGARHTAPGDARATAELFLRMLPLLATRGIDTLGEAARASQTAVPIRRQQKRY